MTFFKIASLFAGYVLSNRTYAPLPYGYLCLMTRRVVNRMGLNRLGIKAIRRKTDVPAAAAGDAADGNCDRDDGGGWKRAAAAAAVSWGYISQSLNPLSGQRRGVVSPVPFPIPALYEVTR